MKKVLWVCNIMLPAVAERLHMSYSNREGWLSGVFERLQEKETGLKAGICFPLSKRELEELVGTGRMERLPGAGSQRAAKYSMGGICCYGFCEDLRTPEKYEAGIEEAFRQILKDFQPELVHIFGTEFPHTLAAVRAFQRPERTLIGIQGLCGEIAEVYMAGLPPEVQRQVTLRDLIRRDSLRRQQKKFERRSKYEAEAIRGCGNVTGRTEFDRKGTQKLNPHAQYHAMNETMRKDFYTGKWKQEKAQPYSIFLGQGDYPLKGMHIMLEALAELLPEYPNVVLYVAGNSIIAHGTVMERLKLSAYGKYLLELITRYRLEDHIVMLGRLSSAGMKERYLKSSVFVCASILENSPNTVGEAMLLGVPVAASEAGGIPDVLEDGREGLLFPPGNAKGLAAAVKRIWEEGADDSGRTLAQRLSQAAAERAAAAHDGEANFGRLLEIYHRIGAQQ